jgi:hypothetical protein
MYVQGILTRKVNAATEIGENLKISIVVHHATATSGCCNRCLRSLASLAACAFFSIAVEPSTPVTSAAGKRCRRIAVTFPAHT